MSFSESEKPPVLFHASRNSNIEVFEPRQESFRDKDEGPLVFATPSRAMASIFLVEADDSWVGSGAINGEPYIVISDEARYRSLDKGGVIYQLPSDTFENNPEKGLKKLEWTSKQAVVPIGKEIITSALDDMLTHGVKVYFVDNNTFQKLAEAGGPEKPGIIKNLTPYFK